jgi:PPM family protein phosphatase
MTRVSDMHERSSGPPRALRVLDVDGGSIVGARRARNEDAYSWLAEGRVLALADGMGERPNGGLASSIVMHEVLTSVNSSDLSGAAVEALDGFRAVSWLRDVFAACRGGLATAKATVAQAPAMESALMVALLAREQLVVGHVGHSRCYLWRRGELTQITRDHRRAPAGLEHLAEDERHAIRSLVCVAERGIGDAAGDDPEIATTQIEEGDVILLCSNGLSDAVPVGIMAEMLHPGLDAASTVRALLDAATRAPADDDATAIVVRVGPRLATELDQQRAR